MKKILIVEDEVVIASDIEEMLEELNYEVVDIVITANEALKVLSTKTVDLVLLDIQIKGNRDGIDLANEIKKEYKIPFVFLTSHADPITVERAIKSKPDGYVVKPFEKRDLFTAIALALNSDVEADISDGSETINVEKNYLFVKDSHKHIKIYFKELLWIKATGNYLEIHCEDKKYLIRSSIKEMMKQMPKDLFCTVHRSYVVNCLSVSEISKDFIKINEEEIPLGRAYKKIVTELLVG